MTTSIKTRVLRIGTPTGDVDTRDAFGPWRGRNVRHMRLQVESSWRELLVDLVSVPTFPGHRCCSMRGFNKSAALRAVSIRPLLFARFHNIRCLSRGLFLLSLLNARSQCLLLHARSLFYPAASCAVPLFQARFVLACCYARG